MEQVLGIIGTGHFAGYLVAGLCRAGDGPRIVVSPRNATVAQRLAEAFGVGIAADNQGVVDAADTVILTTPPADGADPAAALTWREGQVAITMVAGLALAPFARATQPATAVRAMASAAVALGASPFYLYPDHAAARALGARLGAVQAMADEATFEAASVLPVYYALLFRLIGEAADWCVENGVEPAAARELVAMSMQGAAVMAAKQDDLGIEEIVESLATKGGLTERGLISLEADDAFGAWGRALDLVLRRLRGDLEA